MYIGESLGQFTVMHEDAESDGKDYFCERCVVRSV